MMNKFIISRVEKFNEMVDKSATDKLASEGKPLAQRVIERSSFAAGAHTVYKRLPWFVRYFIKW